MRAPRVLSRNLRLALLLGVVALCPGCGSPAGKLYPVRGKVLFQGKPAAGARIIFVPANNPDPTAPRPTAVVEADGSFALSTPGAGAGAPAGEYGVAVAWTDSKAQRGGDSGDVVNKLPARYADPKTSKLTARVQEGPTELVPFQLTK